MKRLLLIIVGALVLHNLVHAQPQLDREALKKMPRGAALVLDPAVRWRQAYWLDPSATWVAGIDHELGHPRIAVAEPGRISPWHHRLDMPIDPQRYPILVFTYRATGIQPSDRRFFCLDDTGGAHLAGAIPIRNRDLVADGEIHEIRTDLRKLTLKPQISWLGLYPHCKGPEPAVFELLGLRFESLPGLPPSPQREGLSFSLRVVNPAGAGIAGAVVTVDVGRLNSSRSATTDASGSVTLQAASSPTGKHTLRVTKEAMVTANLPSFLGRKLPKAVTLIRGARYGGVVRDEDGKAIGSVSVTIRANPTRHSGGPRGHAVVLTDAEGRWRTRPLPRAAEAVSITLRHPAYVSGSTTAPPLEKLHNGTAGLVMRRGVPLRGLVVGPDGRPVAGVQVRQGKNRWSMDTAQLTDAQGHFAFPHTEPGKTTLTVLRDGFAPAMPTIQVATGMAAAIIQLDEASTIRGRVVDSDGTPVTKTAVAVQTWRGGYGIEWNTQSDAEGRFAWHNAPRDTVLFNFHKTGHMRLSRHPLTASAEELVVTMPVALCITGTITDAETGKPVTQCVLLPGSPEFRGPGDKRPPRMKWERNQLQACTDGRYEATFAFGRESRTLRIEAPGYLPGVSRVFRFDEGAQTLDFQLRKGAGIEGTVHQPDGKVAVGAKVYLVKPNTYLEIGNGFPEVMVTGPTVETKADGRYWFPAEEGNWLLVALHKSGYVEADPASHNLAPDLRLAAWGRVEGRYRVGRAPAKGRKVLIVPVSVRAYAPTSCHVEYSLKATTDEQGQFTMEHMPPGKGVAMTWVTTGGGGETYGRRERFEVAPGGTARVVFGGTGRPVVGQLVLPEGATAKVAWELSDGSARGHLGVDIIKPMPPEWLAKLPPAERGKRFGEWRRTAEGRAYLTALTRHARARQEAKSNAGTLTRHYRFSVQADGSFRIEDLPTGVYGLSSTIRAPSAQAGHTPTQIGSVQHAFTIREMEGGRSDEPLDLGNVTVVLKDDGKAGPK